MKKNEKVEYPIKYVVWKKKKRKTFKLFDSLEDVLSNIELKDRLAKPVISSNPTSGWITFDLHDENKIERCIGRSEYRGRVGTFTGGSNAIYWLEILDANEHLITIKNITKRAINKVENIKTKIEKDHVYPMLKGKELDMWNYKYSSYILCPHTKETKMYPVSRTELEKTVYTKQYFERFENVLSNRKGFTSLDRSIQEQTYYAILRVGEYTFAKYKVAWRFISRSFKTAVIEYTDDKYLGKKNIIPNEKIIYIGLDNENEAYYVCGILSSTIYRKAIESFMVGTQIGPGIIDNLYIPKFDNKNSIHNKISKSCKTGHQTEDKDKQIKIIDDVIDSL